MSLELLWRTLCALVLATLLSGAVLAQSPQPVPVLSARLMDQTGTLSAEQARAIEDRLRGIEQKSGSQVVVLMVATTAPEDIAAYAWRVASGWKIGRRDVGDGLLIVIAKDDRRMRLEVARALEGAIPDLAAARIIDQQMAPRFRQGDYAGGITAALDQVAARIAGEQLPAPSSGSPSTRSRDKGFDMEDLMLFFFFGVAILGPILRSVLGRPLASVLTGVGAGIAAYVVTASLLMAGTAGIVALLFTLLGSGRSGRS
ncbi:TPM domain-containing protein, partial [Delftia tsuruhatensis]